MAKGLSALSESAVSLTRLDEWGIAAHLGYSVVAGFVLGGLYYFTVGRRKRDGLVMPLTLLLMSILVCMVMLIVGNDIARAFTLGGTLAIIRFRTVVDDTRDSAFVIAAVVVGMGIGTNSITIVLIGIPIFALAVILVTFFLIRNGGLDRRVTVKLAPEKDPDQATASAFTACTNKPTLLALETTKQGATLEATYQVRVKDQTALIALMNNLRLLDGVQGVEIK